jgi:putative addiction module killer protein
MVEALPRRAQYFELTANRYPAKDSLESLKDVRIRAQIRARIIRAEGGNYGKHRRLDGDFLELKENKGPGYRIYLGEEGRSLFLILTIGDKSSQSKDIKLARQYWMTHKQRKQGVAHAT